MERKSTIVKGNLCILIAHPYKGKYVVFTGFVDGQTALHAGIKKREFWELNNADFKPWI